MCGILGYYSTKSNFNYQNFKSSLELLNHRGPDDFGIETFELDKNMLALGHKRLSIIDLSSAGKQPMISKDNRYSIVFNGEIYNYLELKEELKIKGYVFHTNTDTEVLLNAWIEWGYQGLIKLNGMFAYAVYDSVCKTITLVRDAFGIKPLYYYCEKGKFIFSSEIDSTFKLLPKKPKLNLQTAYDYLTWARIDTDKNTFLDKIYRLNPSNFLTIKLDDIIDNKVDLKQKYWWWPSIKEKEISFQKATKKLKKIFLKNVKLQLRSDVPFGAALSGGIDSSSIVCAIRYLEPNTPLHTFSFIADDPKISEEKWVDLVNNYVKAISHKVKINSKDILKDMDRLILAHGEPIGGTSIYAQYEVFRAIKKSEIVVTLDGQGADELLAGYNGYPLERVKSFLDKKRYLDAIKFINQWSKWPGRSLKKLISEILFNYFPEYLKRNLRNIFGNSSTPSWLNLKVLKENGINLNYPNLKLNTKDAFGRRLVNKLRATLMGDGLSSLLRNGDRNSMIWSIESRVPFLTIELAEFLLSLPESYLLSETGETKHIFREAMRGIVPDEILDRRDKIGFQTPELFWIKKNHKKIIQIIDNSENIFFLNKEKVIEEINLVVLGKKKFTSRTWALINYYLWNSSISF